MNNGMESKLGRALLCGLVLGAAACGGSINLGEDQNVAGGSGSDPNGASGKTSAGNSSVGSGSNGAGASGNVGGGPLPRCADSADSGGWIAFDSDRDGFDRELYMVRPDGSDLTRLTESPGIDKEPAFSPDGKWLAFASERSGLMQIHLLELATGNVTQVTNGSDGADQPAFSHNGQLLAFHRAASTLTINVDGTDEQLVASGPDPFNGYAHPQFTADDEHVVVDRNNEIDVFTLANKEQRQIVQNWTTTIVMPSLSPSGVDVAYSVYCDGRSLWSSPYSVKTNPCEGVRITPAGDLGFDSEHPSWGPDDQIAYSRVNASMNVGQIMIVLRNRGATPRAVTEPGADDRNPTWCVH